MQAIAEGIIEAERLTATAEVVWSPHPFDAIMRKADALRPDMVIKTTRHDNRLSRTLFNYTDWHLIRALTCPLMLVKGEDVWETRRIVACVDPAHVHSQAEMLDDAIVEAAQVLAYRLRGELHIFHSVELLPEPAFRLLHPDLSYAEHVEAAMSEHTTLVEDLLRRFGIGLHKVHLALGKPSETLPAFAREVEASLVVMGVVSKGTLERLLNRQHGGEGPGRLALRHPGHQSAAARGAGGGERCRGLLDTLASHRARIESGLAAMTVVLMIARLAVALVFGDSRPTV